MRDLEFVKNPNNNKSFRLTAKIASVWMTVGNRLEIEPNILDCWLDENPRNHKQSLWRVFREWLDNAQDDGEYPLTWNGLRQLLEDSGKKEIAKQYFLFLEGMS